MSPSPLHPRVSVRALTFMTAAMAAACSLGANASAASALPKVSCSTGSTLAAGKDARVFVRTVQGARRVYGCASGQRSARHFGRAGATAISTRTIAVAGTRVAYVLNSDSETGSQQSVLVYDLGRRRAVSSAHATAGDTTQLVTDLLLTGKGVAAWIAEEQASGGPPATARIVAALRPIQGFNVKPTPIASGPDIVAGSLAASGSALYWLQGVPRAVPLP